MVLENDVRRGSEERHHERNLVYEFDDNLIRSAKAEHVQKDGYEHGDQFVACRSDNLAAVNDLSAACAVGPADEYRHLRSRPPYPLRQFPEHQFGATGFGVEVVVPVDENDATGIGGVHVRGVRFWCSISGRPFDTQQVRVCIPCARTLTAPVKFLILDG